MQWREDEAMMPLSSRVYRGGYTSQLRYSLSSSGHRQIGGLTRSLAQGVHPSDHRSRLASKSSRHHMSTLSINPRFALEAIGLIS